MKNSNFFNFSTVRAFPVKLKYVREEYWSLLCTKLEPQYVHTKGTHTKNGFWANFWQNFDFLCLCVHILIVSIFCSTYIGSTIMFIKYSAFRRIAWKLMKLWYKTSHHMSFFCGFFHKNFGYLHENKKVGYYLGETILKY